MGREIKPVKAKTGRMEATSDTGAPESFQFKSLRPEGRIYGQIQRMADKHSTAKIALNDSPQLEREADQMGAKALKTGKSSETQTVQRVASGNPVVQLASDYDGLLPAHDTYRDSYAFGPDGGRNAEFTYHHIIPENLLVRVVAQLKQIETHFENLVPDPGNLALRNSNNTLNQGKAGLIQNAKTGWLATRVTNLVHVMNSEFAPYGVRVTLQEVNHILTNTPETLNPLFDAFKLLLKPKAKPLFDTTKSHTKGNITEALKDGAFYLALNSSNVDGVRLGLTNFMDTRFFNLETMVQATMGVVAEMRAGQKNGQLNKGQLRDKITAAINTWTFDDYYDEFCGPLHFNSLVSDTYLKKIIQRDGLPNDEDSHLAHAVQWNPGNIHRGPSSSKRLNPAAGAAFDAIVDDGGDTFEKAAVNLVQTQHFAELVNLHTSINNFLQNPVTAVNPPDGAKMAAAIALVQEMNTVRNRGLTAFDEANWERHGDDKMRLRRNAPRIQTATQQNLLN